MAYIIGVILLLAALAIVMLTKKFTSGNNYKIVHEQMGGTEYFMIYKNNIFHERWNTLESAEVRLEELRTQS